MAEAERSGVVSTALGYLALYRDPVLARATEVSDFSIEDIITGRTAGVALSRHSTRRDLAAEGAAAPGAQPDPEAPDRGRRPSGRATATGRRVLLMLDEFPQLGKLDFFEHALAYIRGYGIKACLVAQSLNQIAQAYGEHSSILDNAHVRVAFACNDERTAKRISDMLGVTTETRSQMNYAGSRMAPWLGHTMVSRQEVPRPLLTPGEVMQLPATDALILTGGVAADPRAQGSLFRRAGIPARLRPAVRFAPSSGPGLPTGWDGLPRLRRPPRRRPPSEAAQPPGGRATAVQAHRPTRRRSTSAPPEASRAAATRSTAAGATNRPATAAPRAATRSALQFGFDDDLARPGIPDAEIAHGPHQDHRLRHPRLADTLKRVAAIDDRSVSDVVEDAIIRRFGDAGREAEHAALIARLDQFARRLASIEQAQERQFELTAHATRFS